MNSGYGDHRERKNKDELFIIFKNVFFPTQYKITFFYRVIMDKVEGGGGID